MSYNTTIKVFSLIDSDPTLTPLIFEWHGSFSWTALEEIEAQLTKNHSDYCSDGDGTYVFDIYYEPEVLGPYDAVELEGYWQIDLKSFEKLQGDTAPC